MLIDSMEMAFRILLDGPVIPVMLAMFALVTIPKIVRLFFDNGSSNRSEKAYRLITEDEYEEYLKSKPKKVSLAKKKSGTPSSSSIGRTDNSSNYNQFPSVYSAAVFSSASDSCSDTGSGSTSSCD